LQAEDFGLSEEEMPDITTFYEAIQRLKIIVEGQGQ
jgi:hypothetical protein